MTHGMAGAKVKDNDNSMASPQPKGIRVITVADNDRRCGVCPSDKQSDMGFFAEVWIGAQRLMLCLRCAEDLRAKLGDWIDNG